MQTGASGTFYQLNGTVDPGNPLDGPDVSYEFANSSAATTPLAAWSGNSNIDTALQTGYTCNFGPPVIANLRTVVKGDTLWDIAQEIYGDPTRWPEIYAANVAIIGSDPDLIFPGQVLLIP